MKLTNAMREDFVDDVMASVKWKSKWTKDKVIAEVEKRIKASWPDEVHEFDKLFPNMIGRMSLSIDFMTDRDEPNWDDRYTKANVMVNSKLTSIKVSDLEQKWKEHKEEVAARKAMRAKLQATIKDITTDIALAEVFPELVKFIPKPDPKPVKMLPVAQKTLVAELVRMGLEVPK